MKSTSFKVLFVFSIFNIFILPVYSNSSNVGSVTNRLLHRLKHLSPEVSPIRVVKIVVSLVKRDPLNAYKYYRIGKRYLPDSGDTKLQVIVLLELRKSNLTKEQLDAVLRQFRKNGGEIIK